MMNIKHISPMQPKLIRKEDLAWQLAICDCSKLMQLYALIQRSCMCDVRNGSHILSPGLKSRGNIKAFKGIWQPKLKTNSCYVIILRAFPTRATRLPSLRGVRSEEQGKDWQAK